MLTVTTLCEHFCNRIPKRRRFVVGLSEAHIALVVVDRRNPGLYDAAGALQGPLVAYGEVIGAEGLLSDWGVLLCAA